MNTDKLMDAIGMAGEEFAADAHRTAEYRRRSPGKLILALAAALILTFAASVTALAAADNEEAYRLLYSFSPSVAQLVKPVNMSCEDHGVRMEVISADITGGEANIYIAVEDTEGDRIDGTIDLYDSYDINRSFDCAAHCERVGFDESTGKAMFLIHMETMDKNESIKKGKITFSVREMLTGKENITGALPVDLTGALYSQTTQPVPFDRLRGSGPDGSLPDCSAFLLPQDGGIYTPGDGAQITAMGYIDGRLHIQVRYDICRDGKWYHDNHGFLTLLDGNGEQIEMDCWEFWSGEMVERRTDYQILRCHESFYQEYIADISPEELHHCRLNADLTLCDTLIEGDWQVTFRLD